jgi:hypothetical protein
VIVRILFWSLVDSKSTNAELREGLPALTPPSEWIWSQSAERFGAVVFGDDLPEGVGWARDLIGGEPDVYEEFDALSV